MQIEDLDHDRIIFETIKTPGGVATIPAEMFDRAVEIAQKVGKKLGEWSGDNYYTQVTLEPPLTDAEYVNLYEELEQQGIL